MYCSIHTTVYTDTSWIVPVSSLLGRLPLIPAGDTGTVPHSMHGVMPASYPGGVCDTVDQPGTGSALFYINSWAMVFPSDHPADWEPNLEHEAAAKTDCGALKAKRGKAWYQYVHKQYQQLQYIPIRAEHMQIHNIRVILVCIDPIYGSIHTKIRANTYTIRTNTTGARRKPVCQRGFEYIPKHTKYMPKRANTYKKTYQYGFTLTPAAEM